MCVMCLMCVHLFCMCISLYLCVFVSMYSVCDSGSGCVCTYVCVSLSVCLCIYMLCLFVCLCLCLNVQVHVLKIVTAQQTTQAPQSRDGSLQGRMITLKALLHLSQLLWRLPCLQTWFLSALRIR